MFIFERIVYWISLIQSSLELNNYYRTGSEIRSIFADRTTECNYLQTIYVIDIDSIIAL